MAREILSEFGPDANKPQAPRATCGGVLEAKTLPYSTPVGPTTFSHSGPGLAERNNYGNAGSQGKYGLPIATSGAPGVVRKGGEKYDDGLDNDDTVGG